MLNIGLLQICIAVSHFNMILLFVLVMSGALLAGIPRWQAGMEIRRTRLAHVFRSRIVSRLKPQIDEASNIIVIHSQHCPNRNEIIDAVRKIEVLFGEALPSLYTEWKDTYLETRLLDSQRSETGLI